MFELIAEKFKRRDQCCLYPFGIHNTVCNMLFLVCYLISLSCSKVSLLLNFIFLQRNRSVLLLQPYICLFLYFISSVDIVSKKTDKKKCEKNKVENEFLLFNCLPAASLFCSPVLQSSSAAHQFCQSEVISFPFWFVRVSFCICTSLC